MKTGWVARYEDGTIVKEDQCMWKDIDVSRIMDFSLYAHNRMFILPSGKSGYYQGKSACASLNGSEVEVLSRYIGYKEGNNKVQLRIDEKTGDCRLEVLEV